MEIKTLTAKDFEKAFTSKLTNKVRQKIKRYDFKYRETGKTERDATILFILRKLAEELPKAGRHKLPIWEKGWREKLQKLYKSKKLEDIYPQYHGKYKILRWNGDFIVPISTNFEHYSLLAITDWLFEEYLSTQESVYEFGCGMGYHLMNLRTFNNSARLFGLDWARASQRVVEEIARITNDGNLFSKNFDFYSPDSGLKLEPNSGVYTVAALEQIGHAFKPFVKFLIKQKPMVCVHIEPVSEVLDDNCLLDHLSIEYFKKRNYLNGFLSYLKKLEKKGEIKIERIQRTGVGSLFIEGYTVIVWSPK